MNSPQLLLLRRANVYAPAALGVCDILIGGGKILAIAPKLPALPSDLAREIDVGEARVIPGLVDSHVHLTGGGGEAGPASRVPRVLFGELACAGTTSVIGLLGTDGSTRSVASLTAAALGLRAEGLSAWCWTGNYEVPVRTLTGSVRSDIVFVDPIIGVGELAISDHRSSQPTFDELVRIASDCHVAGLMSGKAGVLHLHLGDGVRGLALVRQALRDTELPARTFHPTHVNRRKALFTEALELARAGCPVDVTAFPVEESEDAYSAADAIRMYLASNAPSGNITVSSDGGGCLPHFDAQSCITRMGTGSPSALAATLAELLRSGIALEAALPAFTQNVARALRLRGKGCIEVGADADLVVLDAAHQVRDVVARGQIVKQQYEQVVYGMFDPRGETGTAKQAHAGTAKAER